MPRRSPPAIQPATTSRVTAAVSFSSRVSGPSRMLSSRATAAAFSPCAGSRRRNATRRYTPRTSDATGTNGSPKRIHCRNVGAVP